jgi:hypothetical protein
VPSLTQVTTVAERVTVRSRSGSCSAGMTVPLLTRRGGADRGASQVQKSGFCFVQCRRDPCTMLFVTSPAWCYAACCIGLRTCSASDECDCKCNAE